MTIEHRIVGADQDAPPGQEVIRKLPCSSLVGHGRYAVFRRFCQYLVDELYRGRQIYDWLVPLVEG